MESRALAILKKKKKISGKLKKKQGIENNWKMVSFINKLRGRKSHELWQVFNMYYNNGHFSSLSILLPIYQQK